MESSEELNQELLDAVIADSTEGVQRLLERGADANCFEDEAYVRPLHFAALYNSPQVVPLLMIAGADIAAVTDCDDTPLRIAERHGHQHMIEVLTKYLHTTDAGTTQ